MEDSKFHMPMECSPARDTTMRSCQTPARDLRRAMASGTMAAASIPIQTSIEPINMVVYNLSCGNSHAFEGWFTSLEVFENQTNAAGVSCPVCGSCDVTRQPSAPNITRHRDAASSAAPQGAAIDALRALQAQILEHVVNNTEDVGRSFPDEARRIHRQEAPERPIRGQATQREAKELREEGIDVALLPIAPVPRDQLH